MSALLEHIKVQADRATLLARMTALLNVAIDHDDMHDLCVQLAEEAQRIACDLEDKLQGVNLPKGGEA